MLKICLIDDEDLVRVTLSDDLSEMGYVVEDFKLPGKALETLRQDFFQVVITDLKMPGMDGISLIRKAREISPKSSFIVITAFGSIETAVGAMKAGAYDYITKPFQPEEIHLILKRLEERYSLLQENLLLKTEIAAKSFFPQIVSRSEPMKKVLNMVKTIAPSDSNVLITGETGTGKELIAEAIHALSQRRDKPLIKVSCAALSRELLESELFGHVKGAFTGAVSNKTGRFEMADHGSLFLDEVDDIPIELQVKLLRVIQQKEIERVGDPRLIKLDVRMIAATKVNLYEKVKDGSFRSDLYYRLNVVPIHLPPLRQRLDDIPLLIRHFFEKFRADNPPNISPRTLQILVDYPWEGNIRELENLIERLSLVCQCNPMIPACLPDQYLPNASGKLSQKSGLEEKTSRFEREMIQMTLRQCQDNKSRAAKILQIPYSTLRSKMQKHGLS
ncbi:transcriptional regulatory protein ZraR [bacterium BMS3Abin05]|nr:transcriptional regulatory protein ZraR [bacterium BMS3Abin05]HDL78252.1 sigma-54-dependent Fis family transcriptional regulator [Bacteroidota bacterium]